MYKPTKLQRLIWNVVTNGPNYAALTFTDRNIKRRQNGSVIEWDSRTHVLHVQDPSIAPTWYVDTQFLLRQIRQKLRVSAVHGSENVKKKKLQSCSHTDDYKIYRRDLAPTQSTAERHVWKTRLQYIEVLKKSGPR